MELMVWRVPRPVPPTHHGCIYRAVYAVDGVRVVGSTMNAERAITAICKGGRCLAHSPRLTPWWKTSWLRWMRPGQRHDKATHAHHHHEAGGVLCPLADMHIAGRTAQVGDPRAAGRSLLDRRNLLRPAGLRADGADRTPGLAEGGPDTKGPGDRLCLANAGASVTLHPAIETSLTHLRFGRVQATRHPGPRGSSASGRHRIGSIRCSSAR